MSIFEMEAIDVDGAKILVENFFKENIKNEKWQHFYCTPTKCKIKCSLFPTVKYIYTFVKYSKYKLYISRPHFKAK